MPKIKIEKLVFGGQGLGLLNGKAVFCWNGLPGEEVEVELVRQKRNYAEAVVKKIISASAERIQPIESHFLCCSPWQILSWKKENEWKQLIASETYYKVGALKNILELEISFGEQQLGYRNKIEFSFVEKNGGGVSLAFFERASHNLVAIDCCALAGKIINGVAREIVDWLNKKCVQAQDLKSLILRSNEKGQVIGALFLNKALNFETTLDLDKRFIGFNIYFSNPESPESTPDKLISAGGQNYLEETICGVKLRFNALSFFQVNVPVFAQALEDIKDFLGKKDEVIDYYSGVGAISLALNKYFKKATLVEINKEAVSFAKQNIELNKIRNCEAVCQTAESAEKLMTPDKVVIVDPSRAGLHCNLVRQILKVQPKRIIYLSCDIATQARDIKWLSARYDVRFSKIYNFFPRTPHIEGLCVMERCNRAREIPRSSQTARKLGMI